MPSLKRPRRTSGGGGHIAALLEDRWLEGPALPGYRAGCPPRLRRLLRGVMWVCSGAPSREDGCVWAQTEAVLSRWKLGTG